MIHIKKMWNVYLTYNRLLKYGFRGGDHLSPPKILPCGSVGLGWRRPTVRDDRTTDRIKRSTSSGPSGTLDVYFFNFFFFLENVRKLTRNKCTNTLHIARSVVKIVYFLAEQKRFSVVRTCAANENHKNRTTWLHARIMLESDESLAVCWTQRMFSLLSLFTNRLAS
jgi:hypothetical protein